MPARAGTALNGEALGLIDDDDLVVAIEHALLQEPRIGRARRRPARLGAGQRRGGEGRHTDTLAGNHAVAGIDALAVEADLPGPQELLETAVGERREMALEPAIESDFSVLGRDGEGLDAAHASMLAAQEAAIHPVELWRGAPARLGEGLTAPVAWAPHPPAAHQHPVPGYPDGLRVGRMNIAAWKPNIAPAIPAPIARLPDPISARRGGGRRWRYFGLWRRRRGSLGKGRAGAAQKRQNCGRDKRGIFERTLHGRNLP